MKKRKKSRESAEFKLITSGTELNRRGRMTPGMDLVL